MISSLEDEATRIDLKHTKRFPLYIRVTKDGRIATKTHSRWISYKENYTGIRQVNPILLKSVVLASNETVISWIGSRSSKNKKLTFQTPTYYGIIEYVPTTEIYLNQSTTTQT